MIVLLVSLVLCVVLLSLTAIQIKRRQPQQQQGELLRLSETKATAVMGGMLIALGFFILYMKTVNVTIAGTDQTSYLFVGGFALMCVAIGCGIMAYTFLQKVIAFEDKVVFIPIIGRTKQLYWNEISEIKVPFLTNNATFIGKSCKFTVGGEPKTYKEFIKIAKKKVKPEVVSDVLEKLLNRSLA